MAIPMIADGGVSRVTFKSLAERIGHSPQAVHQWFGRREELMLVITATFCRRWDQWVQRRAYEHAGLTFLPAEDSEVPWTRVLLGLEEAARIQPEVGAILSELHLNEHRLWTRLHPELGSPGLGLDVQARLHEVVLVVDGLRAALCRGEDSLSPMQARAALSRLLARIAGPTADWVSPSAPRVGHARA